MPVSPTSPALPPAFERFLTDLRAVPTKRVLCLPCSAGNETFGVVALVPHRPPIWFHMSCMALLSDGNQTDIAQTLRRFKGLFDVLYTEFQAVDVHELPGVQTIRASLGDDSTASTADVFLLADGNAVCFTHRTLLPPCELIVLQRLAFAGAQTFDMLMIPPSRRQNLAREFRLVDKSHVPLVTEWGTRNGAVVMRSPGEPIPLSLILRLFRDGCPADQMERVFAGHGSDTEQESELEDEEWVASEAASEESSEESSDEDWEAEVENLR